MESGANDAGSAFHFTARLRSASVISSEKALPAESLENIHLVLGEAKLADQVDATASAPAMADHKPRWRVLLVEDNKVNQILAVRLLEKRGFKVTLAHNGVQALKILDHERFDVVLMDVEMPQMDGFAATAVIREKEKLTGRHLPIIAMTAHAMKDDRQRCQSAGMDDYISKPIDSAKLFSTLDSLLSAAVMK